MSHAPARGTTRGIFAFFARRYPTRAVGVVALLLLAGISEGVSISALFPFLASVGGGTPEVGGRFAEVSLALLNLVGVAPTTGALLVVIGIGMVVKGLLQWLALQKVGFVASRATTDLRLDLLRGLFGVRWDFFSRKHTGELANTISAEATAAGVAFDYAARTLALLIEAVIYVLIVVLVSWQTAAFALGAGAFVFVFVRGFTRRSRDAAADGADDTRDFVSRLVSVVHAVRPVRAMAREASYRERLKRQAEAVNTHMRRKVVWTSATHALQEPLLVVGLLVAFGVVDAFFDFRFAGLLVLGFLFWRIAKGFNRAQFMFQHLANLQRFFWLVDDTVEELSEQAERVDGEAVALEGAVGVVLESVDFAYERDHLVLDGLSLEIARGKTTVVVGESGAGKSTLLDLIVGFREPEGGRIVVRDARGDRALETLSLQHWRRHLGYVPQQAPILNDTIRENIRLGVSSFDDAAVWRALEVAQLADHVRGLACGLDTEVGEHGAMLSGGQRQRLALARALVGEPALLVLDEVTAGLDPTTEDALVSALKQLPAHTTILAVTHQPALLELADEVVALGEDTRVKALS